MTIALNGCTPQPLGSYLKALGVLRLVATQVDEEARGWWERDCFHIETSLDSDALADFFLHRYRPTPLVAPWNAGSGFHVSAREYINVVADSVDQRFQSYREVISITRTIVAQAAECATMKDEQRKAAILRQCRNRFPDECVNWLDAAVMVSAENALAYAPILGSGAIDGHLDFTIGFIKRCASLLLFPVFRKPDLLLRGALFNAATPDLEKMPAGQFDPGRSGGANQGPGIETETPSNSWDYLLTMEGCVGWASGIYRRQGVSFRSFLCSPFTVRSTTVGYGSSSEHDRKSGHAEVWVPLWSQPARYTEVRNLLREGRANIGSRPTGTSLEFAEATATLGVDRSITEFVRYSMLSRRGTSYLALPAGHFPVNARSEADLVRELAPALDRVDRWLKDPPAAFRSLRRQVDESIYDLLLRGGPAAVADTARALGRLQRWVLSSGKKVRMPWALSIAWVEKMGALPEARIAAALAGMSDHAAGRFTEHLDPAGRRFAWFGADLPDRLAGALNRRLRDAAESGHNPLRSALAAPLSDVSLFLEGSLDDDVIEELLFAFSLLRWDAAAPPRAPRDPEIEVWPVYALLKHLFLPAPVPAPGGPVWLAADPRVLALLSAGDTRGAAELALRRLRIAGLRPIETEYAGGVDPRRLAAAMAIPVPYGPALGAAVLLAS